MAIAWSERRIVDDVFNGEGTAAVLEGCYQVFVACGMEPAAIEGGWIFGMESKQGYLARVRLRLDEETYLRPAVTFQMCSWDQTREGPIHPLLTGTGRLYRVMACECQFFIACEGVSTEAQDGVHAHSVAGGIPFVPRSEQQDPGACSVESDDVTTELWWSCGNGEAGAQNFRSSLLCSGASVWCGNRNEELLAPETSFGQGASSLRLLATRHAANGNPPRSLRLNGALLALDPLIGWGTPEGDPARVRGQLYNAIFGSNDRPLDEEIETAEEVNGVSQTVSWVNYCHDSQSGSPQTYHGALYLAVGKPVPDLFGNYAY